MNIGVYGIRCTVNDRWYVGQTQNLDRRRYWHVVRLASGKHHNRKLQKDYDTYGSGCFEFVMLQECGTQDLREQEYSFMLKMNSLDVGYNIQGKSNTVCVMSKPAIRKRRSRVLVFKSGARIPNRHFGHSFRGVQIMTDFETFDKCVKRMTA